MRQIEPELGGNPAFPNCNDIIEKRSGAGIRHTDPRGEVTRHAIRSQLNATVASSWKVSHAGALMIYGYSKTSPEYRWRLCAENYIAIAISGGDIKIIKTAPIRSI